jgi:hypothetical protein
MAQRLSWEKARLARMPKMSKTTKKQRNLLVKLGLEPEEVPEHFEDASAMIDAILKSKRQKRR